MNKQKGLMSGILVAAFLLLSACGSDADTALDVAEEAPVVEEPEEAAEPQEAPVVEEVVVAEEPEEAAAGLSPDEAVAGMAAAWGSDEADLAWSFESERCRRVVENSTSAPGGPAEAPDGYRDAVAGWAASFPGATATDITAVVDGDRAAVSYDVYDGAGAFAWEFIAQPWILVDGNWLKDDC